MNLKLEEAFPRDRVSESSPLIDFVLQHNAEQSALYNSNANMGARRSKRGQWHMECVVMKCMDGRLDFSRWTNLPSGIVQSIRSMGGKFELGHPMLRNRLLSHQQYTWKHGRSFLIVVTYHYSKSSNHLGCGGFDNRLHAARGFALELTEKIGKVFGRSEAVYAICVGLETDDEALVFESLDAKMSLPVAMHSLSDEEYRLMFADFYPGMSGRIIRNITEMAMGNRMHVEQVRANPRPIEMHDHRESIIWVGPGSDFFHEPNRAIIIWPGSNHVREAIALASRIVYQNLLRGKVGFSPEALLIGSATYKEEGADMDTAKLESQSYLELARDVIRSATPELEPYLRHMAGVVHLDTRRFCEVIEARRI